MVQYLNVTIVEAVTAKVEGSSLYELFKEVPRCFIKRNISFIRNFEISVFRSLTTIAESANSRTRAILHQDLSSLYSEVL